MPLGTEVGLVPDDIVLDGDPTPPPEKGRSPLQIFGPCLLWPNGWEDQDTHLVTHLVWPHQPEN